jgi:excisionase family DNA binding protein
VDGRGGPARAPDRHSISGVCRRTTLGRSFVYEAIARGELKTIKLGSRRLLLHDSLMEWLSKHEVAADQVSA